jgi:hypothetical protein
METDERPVVSTADNHVAVAAAPCVRYYYLPMNLPVCDDKIIVVVYDGQSNRKKDVPTKGHTILSTRNLKSFIWCLLSFSVFDLDFDEEKQLLW